MGELRKKKCPINGGSFLRFFDKNFSHPQRTLKRKITRRCRPPVTIREGPVLTSDRKNRQLDQRRSSAEGNRIWMEGRRLYPGRAVFRRKKKSPRLCGEGPRGGFGGQPSLEKGKGKGTCSSHTSTAVLQNLLKQGVPISAGNFLILGGGAFNLSLTGGGEFVEGCLYSSVALGKEGPPYPSWISRGKNHTDQWGLSSLQKYLPRPYE